MGIFSRLKRSNNDSKAGRPAGSREGSSKPPRSAQFTQQPTKPKLRPLSRNDIKVVERAIIKQAQEYLDYTYMEDKLRKEKAELEKTNGNTNQLATILAIIETNKQEFEHLTAKRLAQPEIQKYNQSCDDPQQFPSIANCTAIMAMIEWPDDLPAQRQAVTVPEEAPHLKRRR